MPKPPNYDDGGHGGVYHGQGADLTPHLAYYDPRTQASFIWDGVSDHINVSLGGYGEPVDHTIPTMPWLRAGTLVDMAAFRSDCEAHAKTLPAY